MRSRHLRLVAGSRDRLTLTVRGSAGTLARAFHVRIATFTGGGRLVRANLTDPLMPATLARHIAAVSGLSDFARPAAAPLDAKQCAPAMGADYHAPPGAHLPCANLCLASLTSGSDGLLSSDASPFIDGLGGGVPGTLLTVPGDCIGVALDQTFPQIGGFTGSGPPPRVGLLEYDTYRQSDVSDWLAFTGLNPAIAGRLSQTNVNGGVPSPGAGESEVLLDIDTLLGGTQGTPNFVVYDAPPSTTFVEMFQVMLADGDTVISNSWSQCEDQTPAADAQAIDSILAGAAASGVTVLNATGDAGSTCADGAAGTIAVPSDSPDATAVGGTTPQFGPVLTRAGEGWWNDQGATPAGGAGGYGVSRYFPRPAFQTPFSASTMRSVPDVSFDAAPSAGLALCQADAGGCPDGEMWGGTSMAAPAMAALVTNIDEVVGHRVGNLNAALYPLAGTAALHSAAGMGSDFAHVGLGSPDLAALVEALRGTSAGPVSATQSQAVAIGTPQADGSETGLVRVDLEDSTGLPVGGKTVSLTVNGAGSTASVAPATTTTSAVDGSAVFTVTDSAPETVSFTVNDTTDGVTLNAAPQLTFLAPLATGSTVVESPAVVNADGSAHATVTVHLEDALGQPAAGQTVALTSTQGPMTNTAAVTPAQATTDSAGVATFSVTDSSTESVVFVASDISDGDLPVPGSVGITFQPASAGVCDDDLPTPASGATISPFAAGLPVNVQPVVTSGGGLKFGSSACAGVLPPAFDSAGNAYIPDTFSGQIYELGPAGGSAAAGSALPGANFLPGGQLGQIAFGPHGQLYAGLSASDAGDFSKPAVVQLDPATGAVQRLLATGAQGLAACPQWLAVDPLSGDIFTSDDCGGSLASAQITRIAGPDGATPTVSKYVDIGASAGLTFAPDGTLYVAYLGDKATSDPSAIVAVSPTNQPGPVTKTTITTTTDAYFGVAIASVDGSGHATALYGIQSNGDVNLITLGPPVTVTPLATRGGGFSTGATVGPDGCLYMDDSDQLLALSGSGTVCAAAATEPQLTLTATGSGSGAGGVATGSQAGFTAALAHVSGAAGTPIRLVVDGPNGQVKLVEADSNGQASFAYQGTFAGSDTIRAQATVGGRTLVSAPLGVRWIAGKHATFLSLASSPGAGSPGASSSFTASLVDVSGGAPNPISGATVTISVAGQGCVATTNAGGAASCALTLPSTSGLSTLAASFAGSSTYTPASASNLLVLGTLGLPPVGPGPPGGGPQNNKPPVPKPKPKRSPALACTKAQLVLINVRLRGRRVAISGAAQPGLAGRKVQIELVGRRRQPVASAKVGVHGSFSAAAPLPPKSLSRAGKVRYVAVIGKARSAPLALVRRLVITAVSESKGRVHLAGTVGPPLGADRTVTIELRATCSHFRRVATARLAHNGAWSAVFKADPSGATTVFRAQTTLLVGRRSRTKYSLPVPV